MMSCSQSRLNLELAQLLGNRHRLNQCTSTRRISAVAQPACSRAASTKHIAEDGALVFEHACRMGLEGIVSKRRDFPYRSGRSKSWLKIKNPASPSMLRVREGPWW